MTHFVTQLKRLSPRGKRSEKVANFYKIFIYLNDFLCLKVREIFELFCVFCVKFIIKYILEKAFCHWYLLQKKWEKRDQLNVFWHKKSQKRANLYSILSFLKILKNSEFFPGFSGAERFEFFSAFWNKIVFFRQNMHDMNPFLNA